MNYKKYSLEQLENWVHDSINCDDVSPQEIYDTIKNVVEEQYHYHNNQLGRTKELLDLLNGVKKLVLDLSELNQSHNIDLSGDDKVEHSEYYYDYDRNRPIDYPNLTTCDKDDTSEHCKKSWTDFWQNDSQRYTDEELNSMCDAAEKADKNPSWVEGNQLRKTKTYQEMIDDGWTMTADGFWIKE